ncbi:MAG: sugar kinase [SAR324 cluster bacterium]|nr:sugar kinase [SAR324 cluster bacterium]
MTQPTLDAVTWGETMLRLSPPEGFSLEDARNLEVWIGGAESNMAIALARLGKRVGWVSRLPANPLGRKIHGEIARHGVDTSRVIWAEDARAGLNFIETGAAPRPNLVLYDRAGSAIANLRPEELDYEYLASASLLHLTGVTPALSSSCREAWLTSAQKAHAAGRKVVLDLNFRAKLWPPQQARETLRAVFPHVHLVLGALRDLRLLFGVEGEPEQAAADFAKAHALPLLVLTLEAEGALAWDGNAALRHAAFPAQVADRIGAGDAFAAGFLFGWQERDVAYGLRCGNALAALQQTLRGDVSWATRADLLELVESSEVDPRRVKR